MDRMILRLQACCDHASRPLRKLIEIRDNTFMQDSRGHDERGLACIHRELCFNALQIVTR